MDEIATDVSSESSPESAETAETPQAATQPAPAPQPQEPPFHQHPRFRELTTQNRELKQQIAQLSQAMQRFQQSQQQSSDGPLSQEEQAAITALKRLMARDPELATALMAGKQLPQFQQRFQGIDQMQAQAARAHNTAARSAIKELAAADGLPTDDASLKHIVRLVAGEAMAMEQGNERYQSGDLSVLEEAFAAIKPWLASMRKPAQDTLTQTKNKTRQLPPPPRGAAPGQPAPPKMEPGKEGERKFEQSLHSRAKAMLSELQ